MKSRKYSVFLFHKTTVVKEFITWYDAGKWTDANIASVDSPEYAFNSYSGIRRLWLKLILYFKNESAN